MEGVDDLHTGTVDVRDFIFVVVEQLSSSAALDVLQKRGVLGTLGIHELSSKLLKGCYIGEEIYPNNRESNGKENGT